ncbi:MAG: hypothetical protein AAF939_14045 [Planctomycetota bacterium]
MLSIPAGDWMIESVIINDETVLNDDGIRAIEILADEWLVQPVGQKFRVRQAYANTAVLESNGNVYYADFELDGENLNLKLTRQNEKETIQIEAKALTADVYVAEPAAESTANEEVVHL